MAKQGAGTDIEMGTLLVNSSLHNHEAKSLAVIVPKFRFSKHFLESRDLKEWPKGKPNRLIGFELPTVRDKDSGNPGLVYAKRKVFEERHRFKGVYFLGNPFSERLGRSLGLEVLMTSDRDGQDVPGTEYLAHVDSRVSYDNLVKMTRIRMSGMPMTEDMCESELLDFYRHLSGERIEPAPHFISLVENLGFKCGMEF